MLLKNATTFFIKHLMNFYWIKTNRLIKSIFSEYVWDIPTMEKKVFLTFDDGPTPEITLWTLSQLKAFDAKATFFCIGNNIDKHPEIFNRVINEGHAIGNHTFDHFNGWQKTTKEYIDNVQQCQETMQRCALSKITNSKIFRPPYGKIKKVQAKILQQSGYKIIMWDVLSADFDSSVAPEKCLDNVLKHIQTGSIIVFHDSVKSFKNLNYALPKTLSYLKENGYDCEVIS